MDHHLSYFNYTVELKGLPVHRLIWTRNSERVVGLLSLWRDTLTCCRNEEWFVRPTERKGLPEHKPIQSTHKVITSLGKNAAEKAA